MNGRDCRATFYIKVSKRSNREHELLRARKPPTKDKADKKSKPWKNRRGFHYRVMFFSIDYASYPFFFFFLDENIPLFSPPRYKIPTYPSSLTLSFHHRSHFPWPLFAYKVATHPNVTFYLEIQDVEIEEPCFRFSLPSFPFLSFLFFPSHSLRPFFHGTTIDYRNPLFPYFSTADTLVSFLCRPSPSNTPSPPSARFDSGEFVHATCMVSFISIRWMWFAYFSQLNELYLYCIYINNI